MAKTTKTNKVEKTTSKLINSSLYGIYGARMSKSGERVNVSIVCGNGDDRQWGTISIKLKANNKVQALVKTDKEGKEWTYIKIPFLKPLNENDEAKAPLDDKDLPF